ncbi:MAG: membrane protein insertion efficiency factor YidD [Oscillospiraceae bacterium]|nr:membrane protein insertion efficiency factor YidD [Oscillospiraceae bacterium]
MIKSLLLALLRFYKKNISPALGSRCRFEPTCSEYAMEAIEVPGALTGTALAVERLLRCHPLCKGGYDPVPEKPVATLRYRRDNKRSN